MSRKRSQVKRDGLMTLVVPDAHTPNHDEHALGLVRDFAQDYHPDVLVILGDWFDCYQVSNFTNKPDRISTLQREIDDGVEALETLVKGLTRDRVFIFGNHEARWHRYLEKQAPELQGLRALELERLFNLNKLYFDTVPYGDVHEVHDMGFTHGSRVSKHSGRTAQFHMDDYNQSLCMGHSHRQGVYKRTHYGETLRAYEMGHLTEGNPEYKNKPENWQQGFGVVWTDEETNRSWVEQIEIQDGDFMYHGNLRR